MSNDTLWSLLEKNVRVPVQVFGDMRAQLAACEIASRQLGELIERHGARTALLYMHEVTNYAERLTRAAISALPDGRFRSRTGSTMTAWTTAGRYGSS